MAERKEEKVHLKVPGETVYLNLVRKVIVDLTEKMGFAEEEVSKIEMAVDEACTNVIEHSYTEAKDIKLKGGYFSRRQEDVERPIDLRVKIDNYKIELTLTDRGKGFDIKGYDLPKLDEYLATMPIGGLGIYVIKEFMDEVEYTHKPGVGNILVMTKYLKKKNSD